MRVKKGNLHYYFYGSTKTYEEALKDLKAAQDKGFKSAFIVMFDGEKIIETEQK